jgi:hypothetical protein
MGEYFISVFSLSVLLIAFITDEICMSVTSDGSAIKYKVFVSIYVLFRQLTA